QSRAVGHAVKPVAQQLTLLQGDGFANQDQEGGLKRVLRIMDTPKYAAAYTQHHRPMPPDQRFKGAFVLAPHETVQQSCRRQSAAAPAKGRTANLPQGTAWLIGRHVLAP